MNDITVTKVESPKDQVVGVDAPPPSEAGPENEVDPLAIDELEGVTAKDTLVAGTTDEHAADTKKVGNCDEDAKDKVVEEKKNEDSDTIIIGQAENVTDLTKQQNHDSVVQTNESDKAVEIDTKNHVIESPKREQSPKLLTPPPVEEEQEEKEPIVQAQDVVKRRLVSVIPEAKESIPEKEVMVVGVETKVQKDPDVEMTEVVEEKVQHKIETKTSAQPVNGDVAKVIKEEQATKRRLSEDIETESPLKKLCQEVEKTFPQHDTMINDYVQTATKNNIDEIQRHTEQLLSEIQTLRELAQKKEHEWNNILHLKKVKEEILLRLLRRKQVLSFEKSAEVNGGSERTDPFDYLNQAKNLAIDKSDEISGLAIKQPGSSINPIIPQPAVLPVTTHFNPMSGLPPPYDKAAHMQSLPKPVFPQQMMMAGPTMPGFPRDMNGLPNFGIPMGRQGPTKDVKSIIADYRQRNPDITPRRGRRMKSILNPNIMNAPRSIAPKVDALNNLSNLNMIFNNLDMNQKALLERLQMQVQAGNVPNGFSFKDVLVQFASMQQGNPISMPSRPMETVTNRPEHHVRPDGRRRLERNEDIHISMKQTERLASPSPRLPPPPPYPEISLLPVTTSQDTGQASQQNSLLHGILTKQASPASQSCSPTLAKLLTSPERKQSAPTLPTFGQAKNCGEITITPVQPTPPPQDPQPEKTDEVVQLDDEESPASEGEACGSPGGPGRLVIDETGEPAEGEAADGEGGEAPLCQGCRRRDAQFVCAGCANQWYCSRDCQVAAWDEHSEMCSG